MAQEKIDWQKLEREWDALLSDHIMSTLWMDEITDKHLMSLDKMREDFWAERGGRDRYFKHMDELEEGQPLRALRREYIKEVVDDVSGETS